jgi:hypothetical protein
MRQRKREFMRQRRCDPANAVRELGKVSRLEDAIFQQIRGSVNLATLQRISVPS